MNINRKNWPTRLFLLALIVGCVFLVTLPVAPRSLSWLPDLLLVIAALGLLISSTVLLWRWGVRSYTWVKTSATTRQLVKRAMIFGLAMLVGVPFVVVYWILPLLASFAFVGADIRH